MKTPIDDGGPAFSCDAGNGKHQRGMSLRAYIATAIMAKLIDDEGMSGANKSGEQHLYGKMVAHLSCHFADALIAELNRGVQP